MKIIPILFLMIVNLNVIQAQIKEYNYNFNHLNRGNLNGQDNWTVVVNSSGSSNMIIDTILQGVYSSDSTLAAFYAESAGNVGRTASRISNGNFPFRFDTIKVAEIEIDVHTAWWGDFFGFGYDANNNGYIIPGIEQVVNCEANEGGIGFHVANKSANLMLFIMPDGTKIPFPSIYEGLYAKWSRYKIHLDFSANNDSGSVSFFVKETGGSFVPVQEIQNVNLKLTPGSGTRTDPATWTKMFLHTTGSLGGFDNITLRIFPENMISQFITFMPISDHFVTDNPFSINAFSNISGLHVQYTLVSGPALLNGNIITLTGGQGYVTIKASQSGNDTVFAAEDVFETFEVIDPLTFAPVLEIKNPVNGAVIKSPDLDDILVFFRSSIAHNDLLSIKNITFSIDGNFHNALPSSNDFYIGYLKDITAGAHTLTATATSNFGIETTKTVNFNVAQQAPTENFVIIDKFHFADVAGTLDTSINLPSFAGTYNKIKLLLKYECPPEGCEPWDAVSWCRIRGANGQWIELLRYITPYGVACNDEVEITDLASQIQGIVDFSISFPQRSLVTLTIVYEQGAPAYKYSWTDNCWQGNYPFGNPSNLQPMEIINHTFSNVTEEAFLRIISSGHGWGDNNTGNAAEFYDATHHIKINNITAFDQHLWQTCNPNPTGCQPQNGTWYYNRAGWCPGTIPMVFRYDLSPYINSSEIDIMYEFYPGYIDLCHPQNTNCITGVTCPDCQNTENPNFFIAGTLTSYSNNSFGNIVKQKTIAQNNWFSIEITPNPSNGEIWISNTGETIKNKVNINIFNSLGTNVFNTDWYGNKVKLNLTHLKAGVYFLRAETENIFVMKKFMIR